MKERFKYYSNQTTQTNWSTVFNLIPGTDFIYQTHVSNDFLYKIYSGLEILSIKWHNTRSHRL